MKNSLFVSNSQNWGNGKCLPDPRRSIVGLPDAIFFLRISREGVFQQPQAFTPTTGSLVKWRFCNNNLLLPWPEKPAALVAFRVAYVSYNAARPTSEELRNKGLTRRIPSWAFPDSVAPQNQSVRFPREALLEVPIRCVSPHPESWSAVQ